jgi:hypothetical protein
LDLLDVSVIITVDYDNSHIEHVLDNESLTVFLLDLGLVSNLLLLSTTHGFSASTDSESELLYEFVHSSSEH